MSSFVLFFYRDDEGNRVDHLQEKRHLEHLLPNVPLKKKTCTDILPLSPEGKQQTVSESLRRFSKNKK